MFDLCNIDSGKGCIPMKLYFVLASCLTMLQPRKLFGIPQ